MFSVGRIVAVLVAIWVVAAAVVFSLRASRPTPEKIATYVQTHPLAEAPESSRAKILEAVAGRLNRLEFEDRRRLQRTGEMRRFYESMTEAERNRFLDLTLPEGFRQVMLALNKMTPEKRREIVQRALTNIEKGRADGDGQRTPVDDAMMKKIVAQGMTSFYQDANADVKLDFAPVIEQIQQSLQWRQ